MYTYAPNSADEGQANYSLRFVCFDDGEFLFRLFVDRNIAQFAPLGWSDAQLRPMLQMQYRARAASYEQRFPVLKKFVICSVNGSSVGEILMHSTERESRIVDICISCDQRGQGIGTHVLSRLQREAARNGTSITLSVDHGNPAKRLYERLGFYETGRNALQTEMRWEAVEAARASWPKVRMQVDFDA